LHTHSLMVRSARSARLEPWATSASPRPILRDARAAGAPPPGGAGHPAARALKLPKSSTSRRVSRLEARLGVRLLERSTRKLRPTEAGATYYECCKLVLADLDEAERHLAQLRAAPMGRIRVSCPIGISQRILSRLI